MLYQIFKCLPSLDNIQRCYFPPNIPPEHYGKYAFLTTSSGKKFFVRICVKPLLQNNICILDDTIRCSINREPLMNETLVYDNVCLVSSVNYIKSVHMVLVFKTIWDQQNWYYRCSVFKDLVKQILLNFVLVNKSTLDLCNVMDVNVLGIHSIIINSIGNIPAGKVVESSKIHFDSVVCDQRFSLDNAGGSFPSIFGLNSQQNFLEDLLVSFQNSLSSKTNVILNSSLKVLIIGPDGSGKKSLVEYVAHKNKAVLVTIDGPELSRPLPGETERLLKKKFDEAKFHSKEGLTILLILRIESVCSKDGRILSEFLYLLDTLSPRIPLIVMATTSKPYLLHESLRSSCRFQNRVFIGVPTEDDRSDMISGLSGGILSKERVIDIAKKTPGFVLADISLLISRAERFTQWKPNSVENREEALYKALNKCIYQIVPSSIRGELGIVKADQLDIKELGGVSDIKEMLIQTIHWPLLYQEAFQRLNIKKSSGVLLYGPPGCAKTSLVTVVASLYPVTFLSVSAADLYSPFVGDAEITITNLFQRARDASPSILFIDEIDALVGSREEKHRGAQERILSTFLLEMDGIGTKAESSVRGPMETNVTVIAATNRPDFVDPALLRPGRFDRLIFVPPPSLEDRLDILRVLAERVPLSDCVDLNYIAEKTHLYSGADLKSLCQEAALQALTEDGMDADIVKKEHWLKALEEVPSSLTKTQVDWYNKYSFTSVQSGRT